MPKNQPQTPLVTSVSTKLKKTINVQSDTQICTPDEVKEKKKDMLGVIDKSLEIFKKNLNEGKVAMDTSLDLERLVKLTLLLSGEADSVTGKPYGQQEQETSIDTIHSAGVSMSQIEKILNLDDPEVKAMYDKIYNGYNELNDRED